MRIDSINTSSTHLILKGASTIQERAAAEGVDLKTLGETPPVELNLNEIGPLAALFAQAGLVARIKRRLNYLKNKTCTVVPAKGTTACVDDNDVVYLGVDFLSRFHQEPETLAGVMAHEWGHACALKPRSRTLQKLNWNQIFELRRAHETLADETSGRLLYLMGYTPKGLVNFLTRGKDTHNLKYHSPELRAKVVLYGFASERRKATLARQLFRRSPYKSQYGYFLLDIA